MNVSDDKDDERLREQYDMESATFLQIWGYVLFLFVLCFQGFAFYVFVILFCIDRMVDKNLGLAIFFITLFCLTFSMMILNYVRCVFANPGHVPPSFVPDSRVSGQDSDGQTPRKFCRKCDRPKPDRAHHCSVCQKCILQYDHHCPYVANCVGFRNQKFFVLFVTYTTLTVVVVLGCMIPGLIMAFENLGSENNTGNPLIIVLYFLCVGICLFMLPFSIFHWRLVFSGTTTIETQLPKAQNIRGDFVYRWDLGWKRNFFTRFGTRPLYWFLPTRAYVPGDGIHWQSRQDLQERAPV